MMAYRKIAFAPDEYYHICSRGNRKQDIFLDDYDRARFLFLILYGQSPKELINVGRHAAAFTKKGKFVVREKVLSQIIKNRVVELNCFALMDNHFHLIVHEIKEGGITSYMQKILTAFSKYHNAKYDKSGHLFQGPFRAVHISTNDQLLYAAAYVHKNPTELPGWKDRENEYQWSSLQDYTNKNRWGELIKTKDILGQFEDNRDYLKWVKDCAAKEKLDDDYLKELEDN